MKGSLLISFILTSVFCPAQNAKDDQGMSRLADELTGFQDLDADYGQVYENLMQTLSHPINLNTATREELRLLHILTEQQIQEFINYRDVTGDFVSLYELQAVPGFDLPLIQKLLPRVKVTSPENILNRSLLQRMLSEENNYLLVRYERTLNRKEGFLATDAPDKKFKGSEENLYMRFRTSNPGDFSVGFTAEKDAGERFFWKPADRQYGFDFISCHAQVQNKGKIKNLIIGDFQCQFAQGLVLGGAFGLGKGAETVTTARRSNVGLLPYTSVNESGFYRGAGTTYQLAKNVQATGFYSSTRRDATIQDEETSNATISSFQSTGFHRNEKELASRKKINEKNYGVVMTYSGKKLDAGLIFHSIAFNTVVNKNSLLHNQYTFRGKAGNTMGAFLNYTFNNFNFFSEGAKSLNGGMGIITGILAALHRDLEVAIVFRKYDRDFHTFYANAFSENSMPQNETGFYWGWKYRWNKKYSLAGYMDLFKFPWLAYRRYAPSHGHEWLLRLSYQPTRKILLYAQAREESKLRNTAENINLYETSQATKRNYRLALNYSATDKLALKTRVQLNTFSLAEKQTRGAVLLQDVNYTFGRFQLSLRHALFDTEDYENRHYVYENDAWLAFSMPAYYGVGVRNYILLEYKFNKKMSVWLRYAKTRYTDRNVIGSGVDAIQGDTRNDIKFQILTRF